MTEILTESFCERCGTRYTFESARPKTRLKGVKVLSRGLRNFVLSDDTSIDEAMAAARSETDREATSHQLDAFHETFNFCMSCRQYTCPNCWNETEVRCLSCAPLALPEAAAASDDLTSLPVMSVFAEATPGNGSNGHGHLEAEAIEPVAAPIEAAAEPSSALTDTPEGTAVTDPAGKAVNQTASLLRRFRPGQNLDAEVEAYERQRGHEEAHQVEVEVEVEPRSAESAGTIPAGPAPAESRPTTDESFGAEPSEPTIEQAPAAEAVSAADAEAEAGTTADQPIAAQPEAVSEPEPQAAGPADVVEQPTWRMTAPDAPGAAPAGRPGESNGTVPLQAAKSSSQVAAKPQWPARPEWPTASSAPAAGLPFLGRPAAPQGGIDALWAASNQELAAASPSPGRPAATGIQPCVSCGLSLSASAKFCRRCGTVQGR